MIRHHPDDELLLARAAGSLDAATAIVLDAHLELCAHCRRQLGWLQDLGGELLHTAAPTDLAVGSFDRTLARLDAAPAAQAASAANHATSATPGQPAAALAQPPRALPDAPAGMRWPRSLARCEVGPWRRIGPGMRWSRIRVPGQADANAFLLRMAAGKELAAHTHGGRELTVVLHGAFDDGRALWRAGDIDETDGQVHHRPVVQAGEECVCLVAINGRTRFDGWLARGLGAWMGI